MWEQPILVFDSEGDLHGIWESLPLVDRQSFIATCSMLLVKAAGKLGAPKMESDDE